MFALLKACLIIGLLALNAFFVATEYALLSVRRTRVEQLANEGNARAKLVLTLLSDMVALFSGTQLGITVISLLMGWMGEAIMADAIEQSLEGYLGRIARLAVAHTISVATAFLLITVLLMVLGELVPKAMAYDNAERFALGVARPMFLFLKLSRYPVRLLDALANGVLHSLHRHPDKGHGPLPTTEEVKLIVSGIRKRGLLDADQEEMIHSVFDLDRVRVREIMVPWNRITCLPASTDLRTLLDRVVKDQHSRIPIFDGLPDQIVGVLYTKDLLAVMAEKTHARGAEDSAFDLRAILHQPMIVPESMSLTQMLKDARRRHSQMALVVDEFGTFVGLVTIEDVLEQIVGEIQDEYDLEEASIRKVGENVLVVDASMSLRDLANERDIVLPRGAGYETLAGFVLARLGIIPQGGESFVFEFHRYTVLEMEGRRVSKIRIETLPWPQAAPKSSAEAAGT
ncbi:MAG TPA: hemolysin family protein [Terriglobia bacterium]|nr:hemolysin family protein [Terriglobia bacterium]